MAVVAHQAKHPTYNKEAAVLAAQLEVSAQCQIISIAAHIVVTTITNTITRPTHHINSNPASKARPPLPQEQTTHSKLLATPNQEPPADPAPLLSRNLDVRAQLPQTNSRTNNKHSNISNISTNSTIIPASINKVDTRVI